MKKIKNNSGFSLIELAIILVILGIIVAVAFPQMKKLDEDSDAEIIRGVGSSIDMAISDGLNRGFTINELKTTRLPQLFDAVQSSAPQGVTVSLTGSDFIITVNNTQRWARVAIQNNGNAQFTGIDATRFTNYAIDANGDIKKN